MAQDASKRRCILSLKWLNFCVASFYAFRPPHFTFLFHCFFVVVVTYLMTGNILVSLKMVKKSSGHQLNFLNKGHQYIYLLSTYTMDIYELSHFWSNPVVPWLQRICKTIQFWKKHSVYKSKITVRWKSWSQLLKKEKRGALISELFIMAQLATCWSDNKYWLNIWTGKNYQTRDLIIFFSGRDKWQQNWAIIFSVCST